MERLFGILTTARKSIWTRQLSGDHRRMYEYGLWNVYFKYIYNEMRLFVCFFAYLL